MKIISIVNQKGGCGKTTIALNIAINIAFENKKVILFDTDPQRSATDTMSSRSDTIIDIQFVSTDVHSKVLNFSSYHYGVIDTPPHNDKTIRSAIICSDIIIIPIQDSPLDIRSASTSVDLINSARQHNHNIKAYFLLNRIQSNTILSKELDKHLRKLYKGISVLKSEVHNRVVYKQSLIYGQAVTEYEKLGPASNEINNLTKEILKIL
ncbi:MAG: AAA family ATPase [Nitrospirae bacterium]|nr:AAA family ATPase [Nitrospirota bacterium]